MGNKLINDSAPLPRRKQPSSSQTTTRHPSTSLSESIPSMNATMAPISLNMDIMLAILSASSPKTATSIMETCHFLYHEGARIILQQPVVLSSDSSDEKILSILLFLQAEDLSRCSYVRTIDVLANPLSEAAATMLADIIPRLSNLTHLDLSAERSFSAYPYLLPAFASLQTIKTLSVIDVGVHSCEMIKALQSELSTASIFFNPTGQFGPDMNQRESFIPSRHPLKLLQRSASTLKELICGYWCDGFMDPQSFLLPPETIYPEVRSLMLFNNLGPNPIQYIHALPNLTHLSAGSYRPIDWEHAQLGVSYGQRQINLLLQSLSLTDDGQGAVEFEDGERGLLVWKGIQTYTGPLFDLWALGLLFPIPRLAIKDAPQVRAPRALIEVLASARPTDLTLVYEDQPFLSVLQSDFLEALRSEGAVNVRSLELNIDLMAGDVDCDLDVGQALAHIENVLLGLPLTNIQFVLCDITPPEDTPDGEPRLSADKQADSTGDQHQPTSSASNIAQIRSESSPTGIDAAAAGAESLTSSMTLAERTLDEFDVQALVSRLSTSLPGLQNIFIAIGRPRRCGGALRSACLGKNDDKAPSNVYTAGKIRYKEVKAADVERRRASMPLTRHSIPRPGPSLASLERARYQAQGSRSTHGVGAALGAFPAVGVQVAGGM